MSDIVKVKNNYSGTLGVAGVSIAPGKTVGIPADKWSTASSNKTVKRWLETKISSDSDLTILQVVEAVAEPTKKPAKKKTETAPATPPPAVPTTEEASTETASATPPPAVPGVPSAAE